MVNLGFLSRLKERTAAAAQAAEMRRLPGSVGVDAQFVCIDVETTGLDPAHDRVIELGLVVTDGRGRELDEWSTLINPGIGTAAGATRIHGIESTWLACAPPFGEVVHELGRRVNGRVVVAHNTGFDIKFLDNEFRRAGYSDSGDWPSVCTLDVANKLGLPGRLTMACAHFGIPHHAHDALGDARACSQLFQQFLKVIDPSTFGGLVGATMGTVPLDGPVLERVFREHAREATQVRPVLQGLVDSLPPHDPTRDRDPHASRLYLTVLEDAVADGYVTAAEVASLGRVAAEAGLTSEEVCELHQELVLGLIDRALDDRRISKTEREEIERVAAWLGIDLSEWDAMVRAARKRIKVATSEFRADIVGKNVAFTGSGIHPANIREALAAKLSFNYSRNVGDQTDLLVVGSAETDTAQLRKAQQSGVPVLFESAFWQRLGEL